MTFLAKLGHINHFIRQLMNLQNINQSKLCNATRLAIKIVLNNIIETIIIIGKYKGEGVLILRITVRLIFAITINKFQRQLFSVCGINLENVSLIVYYMLPAPLLESHLLYYAPSNQTKKYHNYTTIKMKLNFE